MFTTLSKKFILRSKDLQSLGPLRWYRKPRWLPISKSKLFHIPRRPIVPLEEKIELARINKNYHTQIRAVRWFMVEELIAEKRTLANINSEESKKEIAADFESCLAENDAWNAEVAKLREARMQRDREVRDEQAAQKVELRNQEMQLQIKEAEERVLKQMMDIKTFITKETLDEAINKALSDVVSYDYAIDIQGNILKDQEDNPVEKDVIEA